MKHPPSLPSLFFTEMWERFSYYGMRALLILYAVKYLQMSDSEAGKLYGAYTSLVYLSPVIGGWIADRYLGLRFSIVLGSILMGLGHLSLAFENLHFFYLGLGLLVVGNGFFKPNMSSLVGKLYIDKPELRDRGFTIFYMGINLGGFLGPLVCGALGESIGWHIGFGAAGIGMGIGLLTFLIGKKKIPHDLGRKPEKNVNTIQNPKTNYLTKEEKRNIISILIFSFFSVFFWMAFEQAGSSMNLFADRYVNRNIFGYEIPASIFQSINPIFILIFAPLFAWIWSILNQKGLEPQTSVKFSMGLFLLSLGFLFLVMGAIEVSKEGVTSIWYLILAYLMNTWGELCLSPVGLSMVSKKSPARLGGLLMGLWFLSNSISHFLGGILAGFMEDWGLLSFFGIISLFVALAGVLLLIIRKFLPLDS